MASCTSLDSLLSPAICGDLIISSDVHPGQNIALDETLITSCENSQKPIIRIWSNSKPSIYLGLGRPYQSDTFHSLCQEDNIPIIRRFSGGGTVLHDAGNLNFTLALPLEKFTACQNINFSYHLVLSWLNQILSPWAIQLELQGCSDFCLNQLKVSGNAQARRKKTLLHHGTLLVASSIDTISQYLQLPDLQPSYRSNRSHKEFITTIQNQGFSLSVPEIIQSIQDTHKNWNKREFTQDEQIQAEQLNDTKYSKESWNLKR